MNSDELMALRETAENIRCRYYQSAREDGGPGSGNFGHAGNPPNRGGSRRGTGGRQNRIQLENGRFTSPSQIRRAVASGEMTGEERDVNGRPVSELAEQDNPPTRRPGPADVQDRLPVPGIAPSAQRREEQGGNRTGGNGAGENARAEDNPLRPTPLPELSDTTRAEIARLNKTIETMAKQYTETQKIQRAHGLRRVWLKFKQKVKWLFRDPEINSQIKALTSGTATALTPQARLERARRLVAATEREVALRNGESTGSDLLQRIMAISGDSADTEPEGDDLAGYAALLMRQMQAEKRKLRFIQTWAGKDGKLDRADIVLSTGDPDTDYLAQIARTEDGAVLTTQCNARQRFVPAVDGRSDILTDWPGWEVSESAEYV